MNILTETITTTAIIGIVIIFLNPTHLTMPESVNSMLILGLILAFLVFAALILKEKVRDEREEKHVAQAGRISYLSGVTILTIGVVRQALMHEVDAWLVISLSVMVLTKLIFRIYSHFKM